MLNGIKIKYFPATFQIILYYILFYDFEMYLLNELYMRLQNRISMWYESIK